MNKVVIEVDYEEIERWKAWWDDTVRQSRQPKTWKRVVLAAYGRILTLVRRVIT
jgi:hypothetical protein